METSPTEQPSTKGGGDEKETEKASSQVQSQGQNQGTSKKKIPNFLMKWFNKQAADNTNANTNTNKKLGVFGVPFEELVTQNQHIPLVVISCITYLEKQGIEEGIFRLSGSFMEIEELKKKFKGPQDVVDFSKVKDPHSIAVLLKQFFAQLPEPVFTFDLFDTFIELSESVKNHKKLENVPVEALKNTLEKLPAPNHATIRYLISFLKDLSHHQEKTKMASSNLALVFGPNLLRSREPTAESIFGMNSSKLVEILILHHDAFFDSSSNPTTGTPTSTQEANASNSPSPLGGSSIIPFGRSRNSFFSVSASNVHSQKESSIRAEATPWN